MAGDLAGRRHSGPGAKRVDRPPPLRCVFGRKQAVDRHVDHIRIAEEPLPVREDQLDRLRQHMDVIGRVVSEAGKVATFQDPQHLQQGRALAPGPAAVDPHTFELDAHGRLDRRAVTSKVTGPQQAAILLVIRHDLLRDVAHIEGIARRPEPVPAAARGRGFLVRHVLQGRGKVGLHQQVAHCRRLAVRQPDLRVARPHPVVVPIARDELRHHRVDGEAVASVPDGGRSDVGEGHGAEPCQRRDPGVGRGRHDGAQNPDGNRPAITVAKQREARRLRPIPEARYTEDLIALGGIDQHRGHAGKLDLVAVHHAERNSGCDAGVDGIAAGLQHRHPRLGRQIVACDAHVPARRDHGLLRQDRHDNHPLLALLSRIEAGPADARRSDLAETGSGAAGET